MTDYVKGELIFDPDEEKRERERRERELKELARQQEELARLTRIRDEVLAITCEWWNEDTDHPGHWMNLPTCVCGTEPGEHQADHPHTCTRTGCKGYRRPRQRPQIGTYGGFPVYEDQDVMVNMVGDIVQIIEGGSGRLLDPNGQQFNVVPNLFTTPSPTYPTERTESMTNDPFDPDELTTPQAPKKAVVKKAVAKKAVAKKATKVVDKRSPAKVAATKPEEPSLTRGQKAGAAITLGLRARCAGFWITTRDEARTEQDLVPAIAKAGYKPMFWDLANGISELDGSLLRGDPDYNPPEDPDQVLEQIRTRSLRKRRPDDVDRIVWVMRDLPPWLEGMPGAMTLRKLRNLLRPDALSGSPRNTAQAIIILTATAAPPPELNDALMVRDWPLPDREEIGEILEGAVAVLPETMRPTVQESLDNGARDAAIDAAVGLSSQEVQATFAMSLIESRDINPAAIAAEKKRLIGKAGLEWMEPLPGGLDAVGGLENLKEWLTVSATAYTAAARAYGLRPVKGALLLGVPGCGKTHSAKAIATAWEVPLLRLDMGGIKSKYVGESEANLRNRLNVIETFGRCVVLLDEIEKALAGGGDGASDGGVSADALGTILSWMNDRQGEAFVLATANNVEALPPELLRKGRFSEIFWIDLPTRVERVQVLAAALRSHKRGHLDLDLDTVAEVTDTFSGAEVAELVPNAMFAAFADGEREITTDDLINAADQIVPMARTSSEKIERLRATWSGRARWASRVDEPQQLVTASRGGRELEL